MHVLLVDDDPALRALLRATLTSLDIELEEAPSAAVALELIEVTLPDVILLDVRMPGMDGLELCDRLKREPRTAGVPIALLTGSDTGEEEAKAVGSDAYLRKPFSPLELLALVEQLAGGCAGVPFRSGGPRESLSDELLLYARDLRHVLEVERGQRAALQAAYFETVMAFANALESKDTGTRAHSQRVQRYAVALAARMDERLLADPTIEYGFLLHDVGKIGIPDSILLKPGPLTVAERQRMQTHTILGEQLLGDVAYLQGEGLCIVRSHHERWDGSGYPDRLAGEQIPLGARVFAVADTLDAMTCNRPYRRAFDWEDAREEIRREAGQQFDPRVVAVFMGAQEALWAIHREVAATA